MDIRKKAVSPTATLHLRDAAEELMYETKTIDDPDNPGQQIEVPDLDRPMEVVLHSPGSKPYARAQSRMNNRIMDKMKSKGKSKETPEESAAAKAEFLSDCTVEFHNVDYVDNNGISLTGETKHKAIYSDQTIGFIADQVNKFLGDWANFSKGAPAN